MRNINYILNMIPHRYPFIMIDKVVEESKKHIKTLKNVTVNEPHFSGHFPEKPIMPGVLILESMAQSSCLLILNYIDDPDKHLVYLSKVNHLRILKNVIPGDQLVIKADLVQHKMNSFKFNAICTVEDEVVAKSEFLATLVKK